MMKPTLTTYSVFPSVVLADKESEISITSRGGYMLFYDHITYHVKFFPADESNIGYDDELKLRGLDEMIPVFNVKPEGGVLKLHYFFSGEQQWNIHISTDEYSKHDNPTDETTKHFSDIDNERASKGVILSVYSLYEDLYNREVLRGDLHVHTSLTDGNESPELTAAAYRRGGYDFMAITDHAQYDIGKSPREKLAFQNGFKVLVGEEIHNGYDGQIHIICIDGDCSISDMLINEKERVESEVASLKSTVHIPEDVPEKEYLYRLWVYKTAKEHGGLVIYPHPYWNLGKCRWQVGPKLATAILKNGLCDAFEIMGGGYAEENNLQAALYYELLRHGTYLPVVASTDNHSVMCDFATASTIIFAKDKDVKEAVLSDYSVAAEHLPNEAIRLYGPYRLVRYARFLADNYFPVHSQLCAASGQIMVQYVQGNNSLKSLIIELEKNIEDFKSSFFGK